jgi:hypothetical protein
MSNQKRECLTNMSLPIAPEFMIPTMTIQLKNRRLHRMKLQRQYRLFQAIRLAQLQCQYRLFQAIRRPQRYHRYRFRNDTDCFRQFGDRHFKLGNDLNCYSNSKSFCYKFDSRKHCGHLTNGQRYC